MTISFIRVAYISPIGMLPLLSSGFTYLNIVRLVSLVSISIFISESSRFSAFTWCIILTSAIGNSLIDILEFLFLMLYIVQQGDYNLKKLGLGLLGKFVAYLLVNGLCYDGKSDTSLILFTIMIYILLTFLKEHTHKSILNAEKNCQEELNYLKQELRQLQQHERLAFIKEDQVYREQPKLLIHKLKNYLHQQNLVSESPCNAYTNSISCGNTPMNFFGQKSSLATSFGDRTDHYSTNHHDQDSLISIINSEGSCELSTFSNADLAFIMNCIILREYFNFGLKRSHINETTSTYDSILKIYTQAPLQQPATPRNFTIPSLNTVPSALELEGHMLSYLEGAGNWDFDTLSIQSMTQAPCSELGYYVFQSLGLCDDFEIPEYKLKNFLQSVEKDYVKENFYHNAFHAADVTSSTVFLILNGLEMCGSLTEIDILGMVVAALCHDIGHPGVNNTYLMYTDSDLALIYNDRSVLENMHACRTFEILRRKNCNILANIPEPDAKLLRRIVLETILATDLALHFNKVKRLKEGVDEGKNLADEEFKMLALQMTLKCADIGHGAKQLEIHKKWSDLITKEFFKQGDMERALGLPVGNLFDREKVVISQSQIGFLNFLVKPMFEAFEYFVRKLSGRYEEEMAIEVCANNILDNLEHWEREYEIYKSKDK